jgi:hypothetical protein
MRAPSTFGGRGRTTKVLWLVTAAAALALIAVIVVGALWRRGGTSRRDAVAAYVDRVNAAQTQSAQEANTIALAYAQFRRAPGRAGREVQALARAERAMRVVRTRVAGVPAPHDASALRARLLRLFDLQIAFARVVRTMGAYLPRVAAIDARAAAQTRVLLRAAASTRTAAQQARVFDTYARALGADADDLSRVRAPAEFDRSRRSDVARLRRLASASAGVSASLRAHRPARAAAMLEQFVRATTSITVAVEERRAVLAYDRRLRAIQTQQAVVQRELARLQRTL